MIRLFGDTLYQWDLNRMVVLDGEDAEASQVHFAHVESPDDALIVEVKDWGGMKVADIPNCLTVLDRNIHVWTWLDDDTISGVDIYVQGRNRPSDYAYTPTEVLTMESLKEWVRKALEDFKIQTATDYMDLKNKPSIESVELVNDRKLEEFGIEIATHERIDQIFEVKK